MSITQSTIDGGKYSRTAWCSSGLASARTLAIFLDGEHYLESVGVPSLVEKLVSRGSIPPMSLVFVSHGGAEARHTDYLCNPEFARFVAEDVVDWAHEHVPFSNAGPHLICGLSLSGLASAHIALLYPQLFPAALCQSGSFWWEPQALAALAKRRPPNRTRFWLSVGDEETEVNVSHPPTGLFQSISQIAGVELARDALHQAGGEVKFHRYQGGHTFEPWRAEMGDALQWLLRDRPAPNAETAGA